MGELDLYCYFEKRRQTSLVFSTAAAKYAFTAPVTGGSPTQWQMTMNAGNAISPSDSFSFGYDGGNTASFYFVVDGSGSGSGFQVNISSSDVSAAVADAVLAASSVPGLSSAGSGIIQYVSGVNESQSTPSGSGNYGSVQTISGGGVDPGNVSQFYFKYISAGSETGLDLWLSYSNGSDPGRPGGSADGIQVALSGNYSASDLVNACISAINSSLVSSFVTARNFAPTELTLISVSEGHCSDGGVVGGFITHTQLSNG